MVSIFLGINNIRNVLHISACGYWSVFISELTKITNYRFLFTKLTQKMVTILNSSFLLLLPNQNNEFISFISSKQKTLEPHFSNSDSEQQSQFKTEQIYRLPNESNYSFEMTAMDVISNAAHCIITTSQQSTQLCMLTLHLCVRLFSLFAWRTMTVCLVGKRWTSSVHNMHLVFIFVSCAVRHICMFSVQKDKFYKKLTL